ncbi:cellulose binding domain-containing protein [Antribacter gilvus]|uniref:cellulose binding domain-containing protein n=1 Tax=Antribacter gilvus TaxID=2304675 RepID=UPI000F7951F6|nr:cellulose binding domain-containing protein [Antribacter gilvus]
MPPTAASRVTAPLPTRRRRAVALTVTALAAAGLVSGIAGGVAAAQADPTAATAVRDAIGPNVITPPPSSPPAGTPPSLTSPCRVPPLDPDTSVWALCWVTSAATINGPWDLYQLTWDGEFERVLGVSDSWSTTVDAPHAGLVTTFFLQDVGRVDPASDLENATSVGGPVPPPAILQPSAPVAVSCGTTTAPAVCWDPVTSGSPVVRYDVFRRAAVGYERVATVDGTTTRAALPSRVSGDAVLYVAAFDHAGGISPVSEPVQVTIPAHVSCDVRHRHYPWDAGFTSNLTVTNTGSAPVDGWTLRYDLAAGLQLTGGWNALWSQASTKVTADNASWNAVIPPGQSVTLGMIGSRQPGPVFVPPTTFTLDGVACTTS